MRLDLAPIVKAAGVDVLAEVTAVEMNVGVISPGTGNKAGSLPYALLCSKAAVGSNESDLDVGGSGRSKNVALLHAHKVAIVEICCSSAEDEIYATLDGAVLEAVGSSFALGELLRADKPAGDDLLIRQRRKEERVLMSVYETVLESYTVAVKIERNRLPDLASRSSRVFEGAVSEAHVVTVDQYGIGPERASLCAVGHILLGVAGGAEGFTLNYLIALADMYLHFLLRVAWQLAD